jgi:ribokinase
MSNPVRVCVVGSSNLDLIFRTDRLPRPGETRAAAAYQLTCGGKGANQAVAAARLGAHVTMISRVGRDVFGNRLVDNFRAHGIDTRHVLTDDARPTGLASIAVDDDARNCILVVPGANAGLTPDDVRAAADSLRSADVVVAQLEVPLETVIAAFEIARAAGVRTILNPAPAVSLPDALLVLADVCVPNEPELELLAGRPLPALADVESAGRALRERGPDRVVVTLGERGALVIGPDPAEPIPPYRVDAADTTGAGDAFVGGLAVFLGAGRPLRDAARLAGAVAALSVTRVGTQTALPTRDELRAFAGADIAVW